MACPRIRLMRHICPARGRLLLAVTAASTALVLGCAPARPGTYLWAPNKYPIQSQIVPAPDPIPRELAKTALPEYTIEIPDILLLDAVSVVPRSPYHVGALDALNINVTGTLPDKPIEGVFYVQPGGQVDLGPPYGSVFISGMTIDEATKSIDKQLRLFL